MIACPSQEVLSSLLADQLSPAIEEDLESHVSQCSSCQQFLEVMTARTLPIRPESTGVENTAVRPAPVLDPAAWSSIPMLTEDGPETFPDVPGYEILGELGRGGNGIVYRARQVMLNRIVALKTMRSGLQSTSSDRARFQAEAEAVGRLQHPNVVQIYDIGIADGQPYLALEYVAGGTLTRFLAQTPQPPRRAAELVEILARAIHAAHERGILHRDLKPSNILLADGDIPKITDFGLAKFLDYDFNLTQSRDILGTPSA